MPLRDHFHAPLSPRYAWESFHSAWLGYVSEQLNDLLPSDYFTQETVHAGRQIEIDVATYHKEDDDDDEMEGDDNSSGAGGVAVAEPRPLVWKPPVATASIPAVFADDFELLVVQNDVARGLRVVAAVEFVSPANKDREETRRAFASKIASYLYQGISVIVMDICTSRLANMHHATLPLLSADGPRFPDDVSIYAVAYRPVRRKKKDRIDIWAEPLALGGTLPTLPLWLNAVQCVPVDFEAAYAKTIQRRRIPPA